MQLRPCGPVVDAAAALRVREGLGAVEGLDEAWPSLAPIFAASPYLAGLALRDPDRLGRLLLLDPEVALADLLWRADAAGALPAAEAGRALRRLKGELHLLLALCDLGGGWGLEAVTGGLSRFADAAVATALQALAAEERARGRLLPHDGGDAGRGPVPGFFCLALGKHGAGELNYSSDIDVSLFYAPERMSLADGVDPGAFAVRLGRAIAAMLQERTAEGYVFRVDLRLRPDPSSTPVAMPVEAALGYYEAAGQNWERAAMIKARRCAGDALAAADFLRALTPFVWRRSLDYAAIADIGSIKRQIHVHKVDERLVAAGHNLKLGVGGIREIEFFVQTQQLILGGRSPALRAPRTLDALAALAAAGQVDGAAALELDGAYRRLRAWEHRVQMIADEQTHRLPEDDGERLTVAALCGFDDLRAFDREVETTLRTVNDRYATLFAEDEDLSTAAGSLVFTGVEDDPETLLTLARMGFSNPGQVSGLIRGWHAGHVAATRSARARELFTRLAPRLLEAAAASGAPDPAFNRFADFFSALAAGVQVMSLLLARPELLQRLVAVLAHAPELAGALARQPGALDALLDPRFFAPLSPEEAAGALEAAVAAAPSFEAAMDAARLARRDSAFRIGVQLMGGEADAERAGEAFAALADACLAALAPRALLEVERLGGAFPGEVAVVALGRAGSREMNARSDLDLMTLYRADDPQAASALKGWGAELHYARFTQRLTTALSAQTAAGGLYPVDLQLRPSGKAGPVAVSLASFGDYQRREAQTWEALALTRARVVWASSPAFAAEVAAAVEAALRHPRDPRRVAEDTREMRELMRRERPPRSGWDLKLTPGGLVDVEFAVQALQVAHASRGGPLATGALAALGALAARGLIGADRHAVLSAAFRLQSTLNQLLKLALVDFARPEREPDGFKALLVAAAGERDFPALQSRLITVQQAALHAYEAVLSELAH